VGEPELLGAEQVKIDQARSHALSLVEYRQTGSKEALFAGEI
jgi:hypothetical protein